MSNDNKKPTRRGQVTKSTAESPAAFTAGAQTPKCFDPESFSEAHEIWREKRADGNWLMRYEKSGTFLTLHKADFKLLCRELGLSDRRPEESRMSDFERLCSHVTRERAVTAAVEKLAGWKAGIHRMGVSRVLVKQGPMLIEPKAGDWEMIRGLTEGLLGPNALRFYAWLKIAVECLRDGDFRHGQLLMLIGPPGVGKSRLQEWIITPLLGGESRDPSSFIAGETAFNEELFEECHLQMEDPDLSEDSDSKSHFGKRIKEFTVKDQKRFHPKGAKAISLPVFWRVSLSMNDDDIAALPFIRESLEGKLIVFQCRQYDVPIGQGGKEAREDWRLRIKAELAAFLAWLFEWKIPEELLCKRFGVGHFIDPEIRAELFDQSPDARLWECMEMELKASAWEDGEPWEGNPTALYQLLTREASLVAREARSLVKSPSQLGRAMHRLSRQLPERIERGRTGNTRWYKIRRPIAKAGDSAT